MGASSSVTRTVCEQRALLPEGSVPRQDRRATKLAPQVELVVVDSMRSVTGPAGEGAVPREDRRATKLAPQVELVVVDSMRSVTGPAVSEAVGVPKVQVVPKR